MAEGYHSTQSQFHLIYSFQNLVDKKAKFLFKALPRLRSYFANASNPQARDLFENIVKELTALRRKNETVAKKTLKKIKMKVCGSFSYLFD
jgi:hypothetical protein